MKRFLLATVAAITFATGAQAGGHIYARERWAEPGRGWFVDYVPETNSCSAGRMHTNGVSLEVQYLPKARAFSLVMLSEKWPKVESEASYKLRMEMDNGADRWQGIAQGIWTNDGHPGVVMGPLKSEFLQSFMQRNRVDIYNATSGAFITALLLDGSTAAMNSMIECLDAHDSGKTQSQPAKPQVREFRS